MTEEQEILLQIQRLPDELKEEVLHYAEFLQSKYLTEKKVTPQNRKAGSAVGKYKLAPDFDAPLEDLK